MKPLLQDWLDFFIAHPELFQFGQSDDESTYNGSTGCTHSDLQALELAIHGNFLSQDEISKLCGYPWPEHNPGMRGMRASSNPEEELNTVIRKLKLPYEVHFFNTMTPQLWTWICQQNNLGPLLVAVNYPYLPRAKKLGPGRNGIAEVGGATQVGLTGGHAALRLGYDLRADQHGSDTHVVPRWHDYWHDPDHGSPSRKERPAFDRFLSPQGKAAIASIQTLKVKLNGRLTKRNIMVVVPTRAVSPK